MSPSEEKRIKDKKCVDCGRIITRQSIRCRSCAQKGERGNNWKGGKIHKKGYVQLKLPEHHNSTKRGYIFEHRVVMEKYIGRYLNKNEYVHHKNGIRDDNRIKNLELWTTNQPIGVRVKDLINWSIKFLNKNNYDVRKK